MSELDVGRFYVVCVGGLRVPFGYGMLALFLLPEFVIGMCTFVGFTCRLCHLMSLSLFVFVYFVKTIKVCVHICVCCLCFLGGRDRHISRIHFCFHFLAHW